MTSVGVIGGGVIGLSAAIRLAQAGHAVTVFEPDTGRQAASWGNAGHIATEQVAPLASPATLRSAPRRLFAFGGPLDLPLYSVGTWAPFAHEFVAACRPEAFQRGEAALERLLASALQDWRDLTADIGAPGLLRDDGHIVVWETPDSARRGRLGWAGANTGSATLDDVSAADSARLVALTATPIHGAIRFSGSGQIADLGRLATALEQALVAAGGQMVRTSASLRIVGGRAIIDGADCEQVLVAAGVRSAALMAAAGHRIPLIAERGYHVRADIDPGQTERWPSDLPPVVFEDRSIILTRYDTEVQAAGFVELNRPDAPPDARKWARLERHVAELGLPVCGPFRRWMGSRPTLPDYLPALGRSDRIANLTYAFGHQHLGLTLAAVTARLVVALIEDAEPPVDISGFSLARFAG